MRDWRTAAVGNYLRWKGRAWVIQANVRGVLQLTCLETEANAKLPVAGWQQACFDGSVAMVEHPFEDAPADRRDLAEVDFGALPQSMRAAVLRMKRYIEAFEDPDAFYEAHLPDLPEGQRCVPRAMSKARVMPLLGHVAGTISPTERPPGFTTFHGWEKRWRRCRDWKLMAPRFDKRGAPGRGVIVGPVKRIVDRAIRDVWMTEARRPKSAVCDRVELGIKINNSKHPDAPIGVSRRQVYRYIAESVDKYDEAVARMGARWANARFRPVSMGPVPDHVLEVVEVDHTQAKLEVADDVTGEVLGRPWITAALCRRSRMAVGVHVHFDGPCLHAVMQCLRNTMTPKGFLRELVPDLDYDYPCAGTPVKFFFDRGEDFDNDHVRGVGLDLDVRIAYAPGENPEYKAKIERFFGTLHEQVAYPVKGNARRVRDRADARRARKGEAAMPFSDFCERLWRWIATVYAKDFHEGLRDVPLGVWNASAAVRLPRPPPPKRKLDDCLMRTVRCEVTREGVRHRGLVWNGEALKEIRRRPGFRGGREVLVRIDDGDLGNAKVVDPVTGLPAPLEPVLDRYMPGLTMHQHELVVRRVEKRRKGTHSELSLLQAKRRMEEDAAETRAKKTVGSKTRARLARLAGIGSMAPSGDDLGSLDPARGVAPGGGARPGPARGAAKPRSASPGPEHPTPAASPAAASSPPRNRRSAPFRRFDDQ